MPRELFDAGFGVSPAPVEPADMPEIDDVDDDADAEITADVIDLLGFDPADDDNFCQ